MHSMPALPWPMTTRGKIYKEKQWLNEEVHVHIVWGIPTLDCAWQWTLKVTRDKAVRAFLHGTELMQVPGIYIHVQPATVIPSMQKRKH